MGRLSEMGIINWEIESGTGISVYSLKTRKEIGEKKITDVITPEQIQEVAEIFKKERTK